MNENTRLGINIYNDSNDLTYENWLALYACIFNKKLSVGAAIKIMEISNKADELGSKGVK